MSIEITDWLRGLGLEQYAAAFRDNDIDDAVLRRLTAEDFRELGVASVGHRRRLLDAIAALGAPMPAARKSSLPISAPSPRSSPDSMDSSPSIWATACSPISATRERAVYTFKHALVQDAAHGSLLRSTRQQIHAQIAEALEAHSPELMDSQPELLAQHYAEAGLVEKSVLAGARPAGDQPPARRWRKRPRNCRRDWTSWRCCRTPSNAGSRSSNFAVP